MQNVEYSIIIRVAVGYLAKFHEGDRIQQQEFSGARANCLLEQFDLKKKTTTRQALPKTVYKL